MWCHAWDCVDQYAAGRLALLVGGCFAADPGAARTGGGRESQGRFLRAAFLLVLCHLIIDIGCMRIIIRSLLFLDAAVLRCSLIAKVFAAQINPPRQNGAARARCRAGWDSQLYLQDQGVQRGGWDRGWPWR